MKKNAFRAGTGKKRAGRESRVVIPGSISFYNMDFVDFGDIGDFSIGLSSEK